MPTGYTADIGKDITFKQFAMGCARAFGATITMRDDPSDAEIPTAFEPSTYHEQRLEEAKDRLTALRSLSPEEADDEAERTWKVAEARRQVHLNAAIELRGKYEAMLRKVREWVPPTDDHINFQNFMIEQIVESIKFDCDEEYYSKTTEKLTGADWQKQEIAKAIHDIGHHSQENQEEIARVNQRNEWLKHLRESLN